MKKLLFYDHGLYVNFAQKLSKWFDVYYFTPNSTAFPHPNESFVGDGIEEITRVNDFWKAMPDMDLFLFADIYDGGLQEHLRSLGKKVFGSGRGDELEMYRWKMRKLLVEQNLPVADAERVIGMDALREYLQEHDDVYVKISYYRGLMETFGSKSYDLIKPRLDEIENDLGGVAEVIPFIVEQPIDAVIELGYDGYTIDGQFPSKALFGVEVKDSAYIGAVKPYAQLPREVKKVNKAIISLLQNYRMFFSTEIRVAEDGTPYLIDFTARFPSPPSEVYQEIYGNLDEIIEGGAEGILVNPKPLHEFGVEAIIYSGFSEDHWNTIYFPDKIKQWVKLHNHCQVDGVNHIIPSRIRMGEIGAVVGVGDSILSAIQHCRENAGQIQGNDIKVKTESLIDAISEIEKAQKYGIHFADKIPTVDQIIGDD